MSTNSINSTSNAILPVFKPLLNSEEINSAVSSLEEGWLGMGKYVGEFESAIKDYINSNDDNYVIALSTGHAALHLALLMYEIGDGDEVITPSFNNIADFQAIKAVGAEPVFCDIDERNLCINPQSVKEVISPKTKAIIIMDYACHLCKYEELREIADEYNIKLIHDAAHSFGSSYNDKKIGDIFDVTMFSFDPVKSITCIDGGALIVKDKKQEEWLHAARLIGMGQPSEMMYQNKRAYTYDVKGLGFRYHMSNLHAAIGLEQMKKLDIIRESRQEICAYYNQELSSIDNIITPGADLENILPFIYYLRVIDGAREDLIQHLKSQNIETGVHWQAGHNFSFFSDCRRGDLSLTEKIQDEILTIPLYSCMDKTDAERIVRAIKSFY